MKKRIKLLATWHAAVEVAYRKFFDELSKRDISVCLVGPSEWTEGGRKQQLINGNHDYPIYSFNTFFTERIKAFFYQNVIKLSSILRKFNPDIILIMEEPYSIAAFQFLALNKLLRINAKTILFSFENIDIKLEIPFSYVEKLNLKLADALVVVPSESVSLWSKRGFKKRIVQIPIGIDTDNFRCINLEYVRHKLNFDLHQKSFVIGYVGRIVREKGLDLLTDAIKILREKKYNVILKLVGNGNYKNNIIKKIEDLGLKEHVYFSEAVEQKDLPEVYSSFDVLVLPSLTTNKWKEQFGRVLIESMACGTPVIGSYSGEIPHVIEDAGLKFKEGDVTDLVDCIERLIKDKELRENLIIKGLHRVKTNYTWNAVATRYINLFEDLLYYER